MGAAPERQLEFEERPTMVEWWSDDEKARRRQCDGVNEKQMKSAPNAYIDTAPNNG